MRKIEYLSPSSLAIFEASVEDFYLRYLSDNRQPREPQNKHMAIGSSFDAWVKAHLYERIIGKNDPKFALDTLFTAQVEQQNRDDAYEAGRMLFEKYKGLGALADLVTDLGSSIKEPSFETEIRGKIGMKARDGGSMVLLGRPDVSFTTADGMTIVFDFKVNGYYTSASPKSGYVRIRPGGLAHRDAMILLHRGVKINCASYLESIDEQWATQLSVYGWLLGEDVGSQFITAIDQIVCKCDPGDARNVRVAEHRTRVSVSYQEHVYERFAACWDVVTSDWIFRDMSLEESKMKCEMLDQRVVNPDFERCR